MATRLSKSPGVHASGIYSDMSIDGPVIGTLVVVVDRAKNLPNRKTMGKQDPYCAARLGKEAKKTNTDRRGGQTPRWDQELRFTVHDSADYYNLKVSIFNDDKKTELIGEAWVNLTEVIVAGGGQSDIWHDLKCKGKYAGEVRIEMTYYDSRPKVEKSEKVREGSRLDDGQSPLGSSVGQNIPLKRRPLPMNPGMASSPTSLAEQQQRLHATGPRDLGSPQQQQQQQPPQFPQHASASQTPPSQRRTVFDNGQPQSADRRRPLPQPTHDYSVQPPNEDPFFEQLPMDQGSNTYPPYQPPYPTDDHFTLDGRQSNRYQDPSYPSSDPNYPSPYSGVQSYASDPATFLPELPPMLRSRDPPSGRRSQASTTSDHLAQSLSLPAAADLPLSYSAPSISSLQQTPESLRTRRSMNRMNTEPPLHSGQRPKYDRSQLSLESSPYEMPRDNHSDYQSDHQSNGRLLTYNQPASDRDDYEYDRRSDYSSAAPSFVQGHRGLPPPPPAHRDSLPSQLRHRYSSSSDHLPIEDHSLALVDSNNSQLVRYEARSESSDRLDRYSSQGFHSGYNGPSAEPTDPRYPGTSEPFPELEGSSPIYSKASETDRPPTSSVYSTSPSQMVGSVSPAARHAGNRYSQSQASGLNRSEDHYSPTSRSPTTMENANSPWSSRRNSHQQELSPHGSVSRYDQPQQPPPPQQQQQQQQQQGYSSGPHRSSQHSSPRHSPHHSIGPGVSAYDTPPRPHPLSQQHALGSSSPYYLPSDPPTANDPSPIIKPLAISPNKSSGLRDSASQDRLGRPQGRSPIARKSVSPVPFASDSNQNRLSMPFSPDSYDALNPMMGTSEPTSPSADLRYESPSGHSLMYTRSADPIINFHGNVVDPSERLPESTWAPEPKPRRQSTLEPEDRLPESSWAPEPSVKGNPRTIKVRTREKLTGARDLALRGSGRADSSITGPSNRASVLGFHSNSASGASSPVDSGSPTSATSFRNRLMKRSPRPNSMVAVSNWNQPAIRDVPAPPGSAGGSSYGTTSPGYSPFSPPPIPAKVPFDTPPETTMANGGGRGGRGGGGGGGGGELVRLSHEMSKIDIGSTGASSRRTIGGRRLLGFRRSSRGN